MTKFIKCKQCNLEITEGKCELAIYTKIVDGEEHVFCCKNCAEQYVGE